jgi:hypothetical protein
MSLAAVPPSSGQFLHLREIHVACFLRKKKMGPGGGVKLIRSVVIFTDVTDSRATGINLK